MTAWHAACADIQASARGANCLNPDLTFQSEGARSSQCTWSNEISRSVLFPLMRSRCCGFLTEIRCAPMPLSAFLASDELRLLCVVPRSPPSPAISADRFRARVFDQHQTSAPASRTPQSDSFHLHHSRTQEPTMRPLKPPKTPPARGSPHSALPGLPGPVFGLGLS